MSETGNRAQFVWYDLMTTDPEAAIEFYTKLVGWGTQKWEGDMPYTMWTNQGNPLGGVAELPAEARASGAPPHWLAYIGVADVEASARRVGELGGKVLVPKTDIPGAGCFSVVTDPHGAPFAVYASKQESPAKGEPVVGEFSWHELAAGNLDAAFDFYSTLFGWEKLDAMDMGEAGIYQLYGRNGIPFGGMFTKPESMPGPPMWLYYISVDDVTSAVGKLDGLGGQLLNGPMEVPGGDLIAQCFDPQGALFALHSKA